MIAVGDSYEKEIVVTDQMVRLFAEATGDKNPLHLDDAVAAKTKFGRRLVHGMLLAGLISKIFGMDWPGPGTIYISQSIQFLKPAFVGDPMILRLSVKEMPTPKRAVILTECYNKDNELLATGEGAVSLPREL